MTTSTKSERIFDINIWRYLVSFWTIVVYLSILVDFLLRNSLVQFLGPVCTIYIALLAVYTSQKEFERWHDEHVGRHPGEIFIILWTILIITLIVLEIVYRTSYRIPSEAFTTYLVVMGILAVSRRSKSNYCRVEEKN